MGFYIRKSLKVGPLRFNLSRSGIGVSAGFKGLRIGTGPRGNYVHVGQGRIYFRKSLSPGSSRSSEFKEQENILPSEQVFGPNVVEMEEIESGSVLGMVDSSSAELLDELNSKRKKKRLFPPVLIMSLIAIFVLLAIKVSTWILIPVMVLNLILLVFLYFRDQLRKTTVIFYELEPKIESAYQNLHGVFNKLQSSDMIWHISAEGQVRDRKYHAGASSLVSKQSVVLKKRGIPFVKTNVQVLTIPVGRKILSFMPDRLLVFDPAGVGAVSYKKLSTEIEQTQFIENGRVPRDAKIVGQTWRYVNRQGGPDRRFKDNPQLPIALYENILFSSSSGLNELIQISKLGILESFKRNLQDIAGINPE